MIEQIRYYNIKIWKLMSINYQRNRINLQDSKNIVLLTDIKNNIPTSIIKTYMIYLIFSPKCNVNMKIFLVN